MKRRIDGLPDPDDDKPWGCGSLARAVRDIVYVVRELYRDVRELQQWRREVEPRKE